MSCLPVINFCCRWLEAEVWHYVQPVKIVTQAQSDAGVPKEAGKFEEERSYRQDLERRAQRRPKPGLTAFTT